MPKTSSLPQEYRNGATYLKIVVVLCAAYATGMVTAGGAFAVPFFDLLGFGPNARGLDKDGVNYALFAFGVLGAVLVGWTVLMWFMIDLAVFEGDAVVRAMARKGLMFSIAIWFVLDTGFSLVTGEIEHAAFNLPFVTMMGTPIYMMHANDGAGKKKS